MIKLLPPSELDYEFAFDLMEENMKKYYDLYDITWDKEWLRKNFFDKENYVITKFDERIGFLSLEKKKNELYVHTIQVCPQSQNQRIGLYVLRTLIKMMRDFRLQHIICRVFKDSPVLGMYERLGFERISQEHFLISLSCELNNNNRESEATKFLTQRPTGRATMRRLALR
ncbi:GNAT family N-acetyltransferase [Sulfurirhabdus autotrophica]|uniref:Acetyltransferase (GNAT) family protein n=1 Tax=Sulfurirhabdus autotrophica TaxID=1706046 RepID=A0A4R3XU92_9PROT|nr:GNAT family N-acetyltransferase [Sulfurirhabdus autotrophica]TCV79007.1 acetyltransferase (GNAT) family protein [Sulfurirhabdus autotrophica]